MRVFLLLFSLTISALFCRAEKLELVKNGVSDYKIVVASNAVPSEKYAARELQKTIQEICEYKIPIVNEVASYSNAIYVGFKSAPSEIKNGINPSDFENEEYIIRSGENTLLIAGGEPRGTLYGVIGFLTNQLGCRWYTHDVIKTPDFNNIIIDEINVREKPVFEYREAWYKEAYEINWAIHNRLNPNIAPIPDSLGGSYIIQPFVHTFYKLVPPEKYMESHPEYYSMINGKRFLDKQKGQLCLTNPDVVQIATNKVLKWIEEYPHAEIFSIDQNDGYHFCECPECRALDSIEGSQSGTIINFVNQIADSVAKIYPDVKLQTLAYAYSEIPPKTLQPRSNVTIRMCHYNYCNAHALGECNDHNQFIERMAAWEKITERITIWDYYTDFSHYMIPFPNFESVIKNPRYYADHKCIGLFAQGNNVPNKGGGEFSALRAWVFAQLMWNPYQDGKALINEFVTNVYGKAAPFILQYIDMLHDEVKPKNIHFTIYDSPTVLDYLKPEILQKAERLFNKAENIAENDKELLKRIELAHLPVLYARLYLYSVGGKGYIKKDEVPNAVAKFKRIINENDISRLAESPEAGNINNFIESVKSASEYLTDWWIIGPFENNERLGFDQVFPPESEFNTAKTYSGKDGKQIQWQKYDNQRSGYIDFTKRFQATENVVAYAYRNIEIKEAGSYKIGLGSNDGVKVWINDTLVHRNKTSRKAEPNQDIVEVKLNKGKNIILVKTDQLGGGWGFYFSLSQVLEKGLKND